jgi:hypothetical protein
MIDFSNEIFNSVAVDLRSLYPGIRVVGEYVASPTEFPTVTLDETSNIPVNLDSAGQSKYARIQYRAQVFTNRDNGKRAQARQIYATLDAKMQSLGLFCKTYTTTPAVYNSEIYSITATYEGVIDRNGVIYRS